MKSIRADVREVTIRLMVCVGLIFVLAGCTRVNSGVGGMFNFDTNLKVIFDVKDNINPDEKHTPSPVYVRFYELKSDKRFIRAKFLELFERDEALLGDELITKQELKRIAPKEPREEHFVVDNETRYVALFAEFFQYKNSKYKVIFPVTSNNVIENTVRIELNDTNLLLRSAK